MGKRIDWTDRFNFGRPRPTSGLVGVCIHVTENQPGTPAENVAEYQIDSESGSYNRLVDTGANVLIENTDDWQTWSTGNKGNDILLHLSFVFYAAATREEWLKYDDMLRAGAREAAEWVRKYNFPVRKVTAAELPGFVGHADTRVWGGTDHTDPGAGFPWDVFLEYVRQELNPAPTPSKENTMNDEQINRVHHELTHEFQSRYKKADGTRSEFRDTAIGYALENDAKLTRLTDDILPRVESKLDAVLDALKSR